jgi:polysaccharide pyruvyl transferase WcaK-like protein
MIGANPSGVSVVVQNGEHWLRNYGDLAMMTVTVERLRRRWPDARIRMLTSAPSLLRAYFPTVEPLADNRSLDLCGRWSPANGLPELAGPGLVGPLSIGVLTARDPLYAALRRVRDGVHGARRRPPVTGQRIDLSDGAAPPAVLPPAVASACREASLVLAMGGGYMTDTDPFATRQTLEMLEIAANRGIPTAMVGQGLGPMEDADLLARAARVLPRVGLVATREGRFGPELLERVGYPAVDTLISGDDAIELAYAERQDNLGRHIGLCLRIAGYSPVAHRARSGVSGAVCAVAADTGAALAPLMISEIRSEDRHSTLPLVADYPDRVAPQPRFSTPRDLARRVAGCRVVVTGAYHLAVFALAQGIPVVALSSTAYYTQKFVGLEEMFPGGLVTVGLDADDLPERLGEALRVAWRRAPEVREPLRERARAQIGTSTEAFERVFGLVERVVTGT